jgi:hypothetical protein
VHLKTDRMPVDFQVSSEPDSRIRRGSGDVQRIAVRHRLVVANHQV